jgi:cysteine synthase A
MRRHNPDFKAYAVEPETSPVISGGDPGKHKIQGIGAGFVPLNCDVNLLDGVVHVSDAEAFDWGIRLAKQEGILGGISSGANVCAVSKAIEKYGLQGKRIVTIGCSFGERYLSTPMFADLAD